MWPSTKTLSLCTLKVLESFTVTTHFIERNIFSLNKENDENIHKRY